MPLARLESFFDLPGHLLPRQPVRRLALDRSRGDRRPCRASLCKSRRVIIDAVLVNAALSKYEWNENYYGIVS